MSDYNLVQSFTPSADARWTLEAAGFDQQLEPTIEAVYALVNGYQGTRAALEEGSPVSRPATFIAGVFNTPEQPQTADLEAPIPEIVVAPNWSRMRIVVEGQELRLDLVELLEQRRVLDMRQGVLLREWRVRDGAGRITSLRSLRFASLDNRHALVQLLMLVPENYSGRILLESLLDGDVTNENNTRHLEALTPSPSPVAMGEGSGSTAVGEEARSTLSPVQDAAHLRLSPAWEALTPNPSPIAMGEGSGSTAADEDDRLPLSPAWERGLGGEGLSLRTIQSGYQLAFASHAELYAADGSTIEGRSFDEGILVGRRWEWNAQQGQAYELHKLVAVVTSRDAPEPVAAAWRSLAELAEQGAAALLDAHIRAWAARWEQSDAEIAGDAAIQREVRFALYHLNGAAHADDERSSVGARALTGERYRGHVFWDNEIFVWPFYLFTEPSTARALLMYRYHTLAGARNKARAMGYRGALYAWESTDDGEETTPPFINVPGLGRQAVLTGIEEHHLAADIAYAVVQYRQASGDDHFFENYGAEMLLDIARFWASRATLGDDERYHILKVIGPDEYHESVDDNAYTNVMAQWTLWRGLDAAEELRRRYPARWAALSEHLELSPEELDLWRRVADGLVIGLDPATGIFEQFRSYHSLRYVDLAGHDTADKTMDVKLGWEELQRTQVLKQADVVMLMVLLWDCFPPELRIANFRFYEPRTAHDSSLSPSFHALAAARFADLPMAERYLRQAARIDLDFTRKGWAGATGGVHIAALGGIWQALALGFLGLNVQAEGLRFEPHIPASWGSLRMPIAWRSSQLRVTVRPDSIEILVESGAPATLAIGAGAWRRVEVGDKMTR